MKDRKNNNNNNSMKQRHNMKGKKPSDGGHSTARSDIVQVTANEKGSYTLSAQFSSKEEALGYQKMMKMSGSNTRSNTVKKMLAGGMKRIGLSNNEQDGNANHNDSDYNNADGSGSGNRRGGSASRLLKERLATGLVHWARSVTPYRQGALKQLSTQHVAHVGGNVMLEVTFRNDKKAVALILPNSVDFRLVPQDVITKWLLKNLVEEMVTVCEAIKKRKHEQTLLVNANAGNVNVIGAAAGNSNNNNKKENQSGGMNASFTMGGGGGDTWRGDTMPHNNQDLTLPAPRSPSKQQ